jgi:hypothetical protein
MHLVINTISSLSFFLVINVNEAFPAYRTLMSASDKF